MPSIAMSITGVILVTCTGSQYSDISTVTKYQLKWKFCSYGIVFCYCITILVYCFSLIIMD